MHVGKTFKTLLPWRHRICSILPATNCENMFKIFIKEAYLRLFIGGWSCIKIPDFQKDSVVLPMKYFCINHFAQLSIHHLWKLTDNQSRSWIPIKDQPCQQSEDSLLRSAMLTVLCIVSHSVMSNSLQTPGQQPRRQAPLSMEFCRQEYWSGLPFSSPGDLPNSGIEPGLLHCRQILHI